MSPIRHARLARFQVSGGGYEIWSKMRDTRDSGADFSDCAGATWDCRSGYRCRSAGFAASRSANTPAMPNLPRRQPIIALSSACMKALASFLLRQQKARHHDEMTTNATDERFVIDNFPEPGPAPFLSPSARPLGTCPPAFSGGACCAARRGAGHDCPPHRS